MNSSMTQASSGLLTTTRDRVEEPLLPADSNDDLQPADPAPEAAGEAPDTTALQPTDGRLALLWDATRLNAMIAQVEGALRTIPGNWEVLLYGGIPSRVQIKLPPALHAVDDTGAKAPSIPMLVACTRHDMTLRIEQSVAFFEEKDGRGVPIPIPKTLTGLFLNKPDLQLPNTIGLVSHPLVLPDGQLLLSEGLDPSTGIYAYFGGASFEGPGAMTPQEGVRILREEMLGEFEFASDADKAVALALILTAIQRKMFDIAPGFMVNASMQGSGKTTLVRMVHLLLTGHDLPVATMSERGAEMDKALTAMLMASVPIVCFDNLPDAATVKSPDLARALTSSTHTGRILNFSKMATVPTNTVFVVTGNNITANIDLSRRLLEVRLASRVERPEQRRFEHPDVVGHVLRNRPRWMAAALAILLGDRAPLIDAQPSGYPQWDNAVRWPLINAGVADPVAKFDEVREQSPDHERHVAWMHGLREGLGIDTRFKARELLRLDDPKANAATEPMQAAYNEHLADHPPPRGWGNAKSIGQVLGGLVGRIIEGHTLTKVTVRGSAHYAVTKV